VASRLDAHPNAPLNPQQRVVWEWQTGLAHAWRARKGVLLFTAIVTFTSAVVNIVQSDEYTARATLLPPRSQGKLSSLASLAPSILSMAGASLPSEMSGGSDLYPTILKSESVIRPLLATPFPRSGKSADASTTLMAITETDNTQVALERVRDLVRTRVDRPTGACEVSITLEDPATAAAVCNAFVGALSERRIALHASGAAQVKEFVAGRMEQVRDELALAESALEQFRRRNRNYNTGGSPELQTEDDRLTRQVMMKSQLFVQLNQEYEMARIEETRDVADIQILDTATVPTLASGPHRVRATLGAGASSLPFAVAILLFWNYLALVWGARLPRRPAFPRMWRDGAKQPIPPIGESADRE
jgi:uncharacterized protein involved in exopolysaccharide biosynthesis